MVGSRTRYRMRPTVNKQLGVKTRIYYNTVYPDITYSGNYHGREERTTDDIHPNHPHSGGPFSSQKFVTAYNDTYGVHGYDYTDAYSRRTCQVYEGKYHVEIGAPSMPADTSDEAASNGATAWKAFKPAKPVVSGSVFLAELRDTPGLVVRQLNRYRDYGNAYLAFQFGWKPFLNDLRDWCGSISKTDRYINQLRRNNGRRIRRGGNLWGSEDSQISRRSVSSVFPKQYINGYDVVEDSSYEVCSFAGSFRYYIPSLNSKKWGRARALLKMWDLEMGPEQVYQLIPWSWLVDWFSNVGDVVSNFASSLEDNLTAQYAYVMLHRMTKRRVTGHFETSYANGIAALSSPLITPMVCTAESVVDSKSRVAANPYGFNVGFGGLSAYQTSILSALGISRLKF